MREPPYFIGYGRFRLNIHRIVTGKYFDLVIALVIGLNVITMSLEHYMMPMVCCFVLIDMPISISFHSLLFTFTCRG